MAVGKMLNYFGKQTNGGKRKEYMLKNVKVRKVRSENAPIIIVGLVLIALVITAIASPLIQSHSSKSESSNYQLSGTIDTTTFMVERAYKTDKDLVIENSIDVSDKTSIDSESVYYKLGTEGSDDVLSQGFLTSKIEVGIDNVPENTNVIINLYGVVDKTDLNTAEPLFKIVIDSDEILNYVNIKSYIMNYQTLSDDKKFELTNYISMNYMNKNLEATYSSDVQDIFKEFIKAKKIEKKKLILDELVKNAMDKYNYYTEVANLLGEDFDTLIKNSLEIDDNYYKSKAITKSIQYLDSEMLDQIETMERDLTSRGINLDKYNKIKQSYPLKDRYEYLEKLNKSNPNKKKEQDTKSEVAPSVKPEVEQPTTNQVINEPEIEQSTINEAVTKEPVEDKPTSSGSNNKTSEDSKPKDTSNDSNKDLCYPTNGDANNEAVNKMINDGKIAGFEIDGNNCITYKYY